MQSTLTCPNCSHQQTETIPKKSCLAFYTCNNCKKEIKPKKEDCCVFCSYADKDCLSYSDLKEAACQNCNDDKNKEILLWVLAAFAVFVAATVFGWNVLYGYIVPQANQVSDFSLLGLFGFAAISGLIVNFGPCSLAVLPSYLSFLLGLEDKEQSKSPIQASIKLGLLASIGITGFYLLLGISFSVLGTYLSSYSGPLKLVAATVILLFGIGLLLNKDFNISFISKFQNFINRRIRGEKKSSTLVGFGVAYAAGGLSCFLPIFLPLVFYPFISGKFFESVISFIIFAGMQALFLVATTILVGLGKKNLLQKWIKDTNKTKQVAGLFLVLTSFFMYGVFLILGM